MKTKKLFILVASICLILVLGTMTFMAGCTTEEEPQEKPTYNWRLGTSSAPEEPSVVAAYELAEKLLEKSDGRIVLNIYPAGQLGDYAKNYEEVGRGTLDFYLGCNAVNFDPRCLVEHMPYIAKDYEEAAEIYGKGGFMYNLVSDLEAEFGIKIIDVYPGGMGGVAFTSVPPNPGEMGVSQEMKVRCPPSKSWVKMAEVEGYTAVSLPWSDVFSGMETGVIDGVYGGNPAAAWFSLRDVTECYVQYNTHFENYYYHMNLALWNSLSAEDQQIVESSIAEVCTGGFERCAIADEEIMTQMEEYGITVIHLTTEQLEACAAAVRAEAWPIDREEIGAEIFDKLMEYYNL